MPEKCECGKEPHKIIYKGKEVWDCECGSMWDCDQEALEDTWEEV
ncbi:MAG: hypothetical protein U1D67_10590 [Dehalococcoidia bacterium]|nr:hypothetical protein [Dehalococcoidia bacterium]